MTDIENALLAYKRAEQDAAAFMKERTRLEELITVARHTGGDEKAAQRAMSDYSTDVWYPAYKAAQAAAKVLVEAMGMTPNEFSALYYKAKQ